MFNNLQSFRSLSKILPFIHSYAEKTFVIKYGGAAMKNEALQIQIIQDICFLSAIGIKIVLVHGGGPFINDWLSRLDIQPQFENGIRLTDAETMKVVEMVLVGQVNKNLVSLLNTFPVCSIGLSGKDARLVTASKLFDSTSNFVGKVDKVNVDILHLLLKNNYIPVIASVASDIFGQSYNINADTFASFLASSLNADKLILLTDTAGVMTDIDDPDTLIKHLNYSSINQLKKDKIIHSGMIPKVDSCVYAINNGVSSAHIISGNYEHVLLLELFTKCRSGSMITLD